MKLKKEIEIQEFYLTKIQIFRILRKYYDEVKSDNSILSKKKEIPTNGGTSYNKLFLTHIEKEKTIIYTNISYQEILEAINYMLKDRHMTAISFEEINDKTKKHVIKVTSKNYCKLETKVLTKYLYGIKY